MLVFKFTLKYMLGNVYIDKIQFLCCIQSNTSFLISKQLGRKDFSMMQLSMDSFSFSIYVPSGYKLFQPNLCLGEAELDSYQCSKFWSQNFVILKILLP